MLGYGQSAKPDADVSRGIQNELFAALYAHWELEWPDIVAHDFGGSVALRGRARPTSMRPLDPPNTTTPVVACGHRNKVPATAPDRSSSITA